MEWAGGDILIVDDDEHLRATLMAALQDPRRDVRACPDTRSALGLLAEWRPQLLILDVALPDGDAFDVLAAVSAQTPTPLVVAMSGVASPTHSFRLAQLGVRAFLEKPFGIEELNEAIRRAAEDPPDLRPLLRGSVGMRAIRDVEEEVRTTMLDEAMARARGSRRGAARLLDVSRQLIQYMLRVRDRS